MWINFEQMYFRIIGGENTYSTVYGTRLGTKIKKIYFHDTMLARKQKCRTGTEIIELNSAI